MYQIQPGDTLSPDQQEEAATLEAASDIYLADDGTLDTVFRCRNCGGEERYTFAGGDGEETYEEFLEWAFEDANEGHECSYGGAL